MEKQNNYPNTIIINSNEYYISNDKLEIPKEDFENIKLSDILQGLVIMIKFAEIKIINDTTIEAKSMINLPYDPNSFPAEFIQDCSDAFTQLIGHNERYQVSEITDDDLGKTFEFRYTASGVTLKEVADKVIEEMISLESRIKEILVLKYDLDKIFEDADEKTMTFGGGTCMSGLQIRDTFYGKFIIPIDELPY
jgi:hypothetical protein